MNEQEEPREPHIIVTGEGEYATPPDLAVLLLTVMRQAKTARQAMDAASIAMQDVVNEMKAMGIEGRDLQTSGLRINPVHYRPNNRDSSLEPKVVGYTVANTLTVRVRDLARTGEMLDKAITLGVNQDGDIFFANDKPGEARDEAHRRAVVNAKLKALILAEAAGVRLGRLMRISDGSDPSHPVYSGGGRGLIVGSAPGIPVEAGENIYSARVILTFEIQQDAA